MMKFLYASLLALFLCVPSDVYAAFSDSVAVQNTIFTGDVQIGLKEYELRNGKEIPYENPKTILPGDQISKIPRITNYAEPCWIRARILFQNASPELEGFDEEMLLHIGDDWKKVGEYYYYTKVLDSKKSVDLFTGLSVPAAWTEAHSEQELGLEVRVDAIQAAHFQPDFRAMSPWGNQTIEQCLHETNGTITCKKEKISLRVQFNGTAHKLLAVPDDFFSNFSDAMPGDFLMDEVEVSNSTEKEAEIFFQTKVENQSAIQEVLLKKMKLTVAMEKGVIYEGDLYASSLNQGISLGKFLPGQKEILTFTIEVPEELKNAYALQEASVTWIFSVKEEEDCPSADTGENGNGTETYGNATGNGNEAENEKASSVKTGDDSPIGILILYIMLGAAVFPVSLKVRKGGKYEK